MELLLWVCFGLLGFVLFVLFFFFTPASTHVLDRYRLVSLN